MENKILVCYKSVTGFTQRYAEMIADELACTLMNFKDVNAETVLHYDVVVFGGRFHAGTVDGLKKAKELISKSMVKTFVVFATGAMPKTATETIQQAWKNNFTDGELHKIPHFYLPGGLCYERMPLPEKIMMKAFAAVMKNKMRNKTDKTAEDEEFEQKISTSYDISSKEYIKPLVLFLKGENNAQD